MCSSDLGCDQCPGREYRAESFDVPEKGTAVVRFEAAYGQPYLRRLERRLHLEKTTGELAVTDVAETDRAVEFKENLVTRLPVTVEDGQIVIHGRKHFVRIVLRGVCGEIEQQEVCHVNHQGEPEQVHVLQWKVEPQQVGAGQGYVYMSAFTVSLDI